MSNFRSDPILGRGTFIAEHRRGRPNDFSTVASVDQSLVEISTAGCPFCPGNESATPAAILEANDENGQWQVRVIPNKYPAMVASDANSTDGAHEVFVETRRHTQFTKDLTETELATIFATYLERLTYWRNDGRYKYAMLFKNVGPQGGASLVHLHSQLVVLPRVPLAISSEITRLTAYLAEKGRCAYCDRIQEQRDAEQRVVLDRDGLIAFCPFASLHPFETWILPTSHEPSFQESSQIESLASVYLDVISRVEQIAQPAGYNVVFHSSPWELAFENVFHWRIEIRPRLGTLAGLELGTGMYINQVSPESAAARLRELA